MNFIKTVQTTSTLSITPELAAKMLGTSVKNRNLRPSWVKSLAGAMRRGEWRLQPHGIAFDSAGHLIDGHHRLNAVIRAGVAVPMSVTLGAEPDCVKVMDQGLGRTISDVLEIDKRVAQSLRLAAELVFAENKPTPQQVETLCATPLLGILKGLVCHCNNTARYFSSAPMRLAAAVCIMQGHDESFVYQQYRALVLAKYPELTPLSQSLMQQVTIGGSKLNAAHSADVLARGLRVFNPEHKLLTSVKIHQQHLSDANAQVRDVLGAALKGGKRA